MLNIDTVALVPFKALQAVSQASVSSQLVPLVCLVNDCIPSWKLLTALSVQVFKAIIPFWRCEIAYNFPDGLSLTLENQLSNSHLLSPSPVCLNIHIIIIVMSAWGCPRLKRRCCWLQEEIPVPLQSRDRSQSQVRLFSCTVQMHVCVFL